MDSKKPVCSHGTSCYRLNPLHFRRMAHPHLDGLLDSMPEDKPIILPDELTFACSNRGLLKDQLEIARTLRKEKPNLGESSKPSESKDDKKDDAKVHNRNSIKTDIDEDGDDELQVEMLKCTREEAIIMLAECGELPEYLAPPQKFAEKHRLAAPYYMFFATVQKDERTWLQDRSVTLPELLDRSLGKITNSLHLNFVVDIGWLCAQYMLAEQKADMTVYYGDLTDDCPLPSTIKVYKMTCPNSFGCHHTKLSILQYQDGGIRIIVSTANLYKDDWHLRTQGVWMSPHLPRLPISARATDGESPTGFKQELLRYLSEYKQDMDQWRAKVKRADFSEVNVALVFSVPTTSRPDVRRDQWGHKRLANLLKNHVDIPADEPRTAIIAQSSSLGNFGESYDSWVGSQFGQSVGQTTKGVTEFDFKLIFPTIDNYKNSYDMPEASNCLCYTERGHEKQRWLERHLHQWVADGIKRSSAVPHIKTFTRISSDESKIWWFVLGSANFSKAAWGYKHGANIRVLNYEAAVVFLPKFVTGTTSFPAKSNLQSRAPTFPIPYDLPLTRYRRSDKPFVSEFFQKGDNVFSG